MRPTAAIAVDTEVPTPGAGELVALSTVRRTVLVEDTRTWLAADSAERVATASRTWLVAGRAERVAPTVRASKCVAVVPVAARSEFERDAMGAACAFSTTDRTAAEVVFSVVVADATMALAEGAWTGALVGLTVGGWTVCRAGGVGSVDAGTALGGGELAVGGAAVTAEARLATAAGTRSAGAVATVLAIWVVGAAVSVATCGVEATVATTPGTPELAAAVPVAAKTARHAATVAALLHSAREPGC
jgi:hypothetical protein